MNDLEVSDRVLNRVAHAGAELGTQAESTDGSEVRRALDDAFCQGGDRSSNAQAPLPALLRAMQFATSRDARLYWQDFRWRLSGKIDRELFRRAWELTLRRHEVFSLDIRLADGGAPVLQKLDGPLLVWSDPGPGEAVEPGGCGEEASASDGGARAVQCLSLIGPVDDQWELRWRSHHAWMDGRSRQIVLKDVRGAYGRLEAGLDPFPEAAPSFLAVLESRSLLAEAPGSLAFWSDQLAGISSATPLGFGLGHQTAPSEEEAFRNRIRTTIPDDLAELLLRRSAELGLTINSIFQGVWALFLSRTASREQVSFGAPRACRYADGGNASGAVGLLMNMVPVVVAVHDRESVTDFLVRIRRNWLAIRPHETMPISSMRGVGTGVGNPALFESVLACEQRPPASPVAGESTAWRVVDSHLEGWTDVPLVIQIFTGASIELDLAGCGKRFPGPALAELSERLATLVGNLLEDPAALVGDVALLRPQEATRCMELGMAAPATVVGSVTGRFDAIAADHGGRIAIEMEERKLSYAEVSASADRLARALRASGVLAGDRVAVLLDRSPETVVLFLAILRAGAAYVPIDSRYPAARVERILNDAAPRILVTRPDGLPGVETGSVAVVTLDHLAGAAGAAETEEPLPSLSPDSPAYVMYSSGSTGEPKGIVIPHRGITRLVVEPDYVSLNPDTRILQLASLSFDAATFEIWGPLLNGGCCVLYPGDVPDLRTLEETLAVKRVNTAFFTTSLFNLIARENPRLLAPLREVLVGGEALAPASMGKVYEELPDIVLSNVYGPTENTTFSSWYRIPRDHDFRLPIPLGRPIRGSSAHVVDHGGRLLPHGVAGELLLGGAGVGLGYLNKPELTAQRFVAGFDDSTRTCYRSGDLAYVLPDGLIEFVDRIDEQLKIRGFRVEPAEIQGELLRLPGVRAVHVAGEGTPRGGKRLVAWIVASPGTNAESDILEPLARRLPDYMIPASLVFVDELPLNLNGKIDRSALPSPAGADGPVRGAIDGLTETEQRLADIWEATLGDRPPSRRTSFVSSGGDSLGAVSMLMKISREFGVFLNHGEFMADDSLRGIAGLIDRKSGEGRGLPRLGKREDRGNLLPTREMREFYMKREMNPQDRLNFVIVRGFILRGELDVLALEAALRGTVDEHEILRTSLEERDGELQLRVAPPGGTMMKVEVISQRDHASALAAALALHDEECRKGISVLHPQPVRVRLIKVDESTHLLVIGVHHMVFDGHSVRIFLDGVSAKYRVLAAGGSVEPAPTRFDYWDEASSVEHWMSPEMREEAMSFLRSVFDDFPDVSLPVEEQVHVGLGEEMCYRFWTVDPGFARQVDQRCREGRVTALVFFIALLKVLYFRYNARGDHPMATPGNGRFLEGSENIVGDFGPHRFIREQLEGDMSIPDALSTVASALSQSFRFPRITRADAISVASLEMNLRTNKTSCPKVLIQLGSESALGLDGIEVEGLERTQHFNEHRIQFLFRSWNSKPGLRIAYPKALFQDVAIERLVFNLEQILRIAIDRPDTLLRDLPDLRDREAGLRPLDRHERESSVFQPFIPLGLETSHTIR
jgi:amino acid adenylation domain-containing protein